MNKLNLDELRKDMITSQLVRRDISDENVLKVMEKVRRHRFVREKDMTSAYEDHPLGIGEGQTISQPYMVALMTQVLDLKEGDSVLEIGTGSGYQTAILAETAKKVYTIERFESLSIKAEMTLRELGYKNIEFFVGDGSEGVPEKAPYSKILVTAGAKDIPAPLFEQ